MAPFVGPKGAFKQPCWSDGEDHSYLEWDAVLGPNGAPIRTTRIYSKSVGKLLAEVPGTNATYTFNGNEYYVRAKIISSKRKANPGYAMLDEVECAWTQPVLVSLPKLSISRTPRGSLQLSLSGDSNRTYQIQVSRDLRNWSPINSSYRPSDFTPAPAPSDSSLFYRAVVPTN